MFDELSDRDQSNLRFLLMAPADVMDQWWEQASPDDIEYAGALLAVAKWIIIDKAVMQTGTEEAAQLLEQFTLKNS